jgi:hypothetical protein
VSIVFLAYIFRIVYYISCSGVVCGIWEIKVQRGENHYKERIVVLAYIFMLFAIFHVVVCVCARAFLRKIVF